MSIYEWFLNVYSPEGRQEFVEMLAPGLASLVRPGTAVLDLCCGTGPFTFWLEKQGAAVTGIDYMPLMIERARTEAKARHSAAHFIQADVLSHDLGKSSYDLIVFLGNALMDFTLNSFQALEGRVARALRPNGRFVVHYVDGMQLLMEKQANQRPSTDPAEITRSFKRYIAEAGAYVETFHNNVTGESIDYMGYLYTPPLVRLALEDNFVLRHSTHLSSKSFLDIFSKR